MMHPSSLWTMPYMFDLSLFWMLQLFFLIARVEPTAVRHRRIGQRGATRPTPHAMRLGAVALGLMIIYRSNKWYLEVPNRI